MKCHACEEEIETETTVVDTHDDCLATCGCWVCVEIRDQMEEDRREQVVFDMLREWDAP